MNNEKNYHTLNNEVEVWRGRILERICNVENSIDLYLANFFTRDTLSNDAILNLIFKTNRITLESKRQIFEYVLKNYFPEDYDDFLPRRNQLIKLLEKRNILAHYLADYSDEAIENQNEKISFKKFKNFSENEDFKIKDLKKLMAQATIISSLIYVMMMKRWFPDEWVKLSNPPQI